jgi:hypothetical protein
LDTQTRKMSKNDRRLDKFFLVWKCPPEESGPETAFRGFGGWNPPPNPEDPAGVYRLEAPPPQPYFHRN